MTNLSIQDRINQELNKILQALQQLEIFLRELSHQSDVMYQNALILLRLICMEFILELSVYLKRLLKKLIKDSQRGINGIEIY
ncbi:MAG: hypothetical protein PX636_17025 [Microcystis sp. M53598_WE2]|uniref:hypothetical protein n=1 Tax=Microcystis sp. M53598_WE2 TaxID=3030677 RepID=UPI00258C5F8F|nr:hypothetical protein [Microcystis sp. M53598_WE2]MDJ0672640.1 hypothetical protein [Microcystis sp. M53598_WE2]